MYIFRGRGVFTDVYRANEKIVTSGATSLADIDLPRTYQAIDSVASSRIPSLFCDITNDKNFKKLGIEICVHTSAYS